jgi:hypothetical protein
MRIFAHCAAAAAKFMNYAAYSAAAAFANVREKEDKLRCVNAADILECINE